MLGSRCRNMVPKSLHRKARDEGVLVTIQVCTTESTTFQQVSALGGV